MKKAILLLVFLGWSCTAANAQGRIQDGLYKIYKGSDIENLGSCKKLKLDGVAFQYYKNGDIQRQSWYENNQLHGATKLFSLDKKLVKIKVYHRDNLIEVKELGAK